MSPAWRLPPRRALRLAAVLVASLLVVAVLSHGRDGALAALGVVLGYLGGLVPAVARTDGVGHRGLTGGRHPRATGARTALDTPDQHRYVRDRTGASRAGSPRPSRRGFA